MIQPFVAKVPGGHPPTRAHGTPNPAFRLGLAPLGLLCGDCPYMAATCGSPYDGPDYTMGRCRIFPILGTAIWANFPLSHSQNYG